jgi:alkyldihydroxyacetonephosphate synthase
MQSVTGRLPSATARGKALRRDLAALGIAASCETTDLWAASRDCSATALLWTKARVAPHPPDVVAWPQDTEQVAALVRFAMQHRVPVVPTGSGTGVAGGAVALRGGIALDTKRLTEPLSIDLPERAVDTGAGVGGGRLEELLAGSGATLGHRPASLPGGTVGGWLATRSAGSLSTRYGSIAQMVLSLEAVDGTGEILRTLDAPSGGPDLAQLLLGSEGTLAVFTSARLRIWPRPARPWLTAVRFPSLRHALGAVREVLRAGLRPSVVRVQDALDTLLASTGPLRVPQPLKWLVDGAQAEALRLSLRAPMLLNRLADALPSASLLVLGFEADSGEEAEAEGQAALAICGQGQGEDVGPTPAHRSLASAERSGWTQAPLFAAGAYVENLDFATTWDRAEALYRAIRRAVDGLAFVRGHFAHAAAEGCALETSLIGIAGAAADDIAFASPEDAQEDLEEGERRRHAACAAALSAAVEEGATISHHRGVGASRQVALRRELGEGMRQLRALKQAFDPHGILNPGKLLL